MDGWQVPDEVPERQGGAGPLAAVRLHDGQVVRATVAGRVLEADRTWWYVCELVLPSRTQAPGGRLTAEPWPVVFQVPADRVAALPGQDYSAVPTTRSPAPRPPRARRPGPVGHRSAAVPAAAPPGRQQRRDGAPPGPAPQGPPHRPAAGGGRAAGPAAPWVLEELQYAAGAVPRRAVHAAGCFDIYRRCSPLPAPADVQHALAQPGTTACPTCLPDRSR